MFDAYARRADCRDAEGQESPFTIATGFAVFMDGEGSEPTFVLEGREALTPVLAEQGTRHIMIASLRYLDTFMKFDQSWDFAERNLLLDSSETRSL